MPDLRGALGRELPEVRRRLHELVTRDRRRRREPPVVTLLGRECPVEAPLAGDHDPLGHVAQHGVARSLERAPRARTAGRTTLPPDHLPTQQQPEVLEDLRHVGGQRPVRAAAEVGDVDGDPPAGLQHPRALGEDAVQHPQVLEVGRRDTVDAEALLVLLAGEVRRRRHHERHRVVRHVVHVPGVAAMDDVDDGVAVDGGVGGDRGRDEAVVEHRRVVALAPTGAEVGGRGRPPDASRPRRRQRCDAHRPAPAFGSDVSTASVGGS